MSSKEQIPMTHVEVLIVGAGVSGVGAAIRLLGEGIEDFVVLEKARGLGGTWRDNTYPGCACDVPSILYSYSFAPKPDWSRVFARQGEILDYVRDVATRHRVERHIRYEEPLLDARWDEVSTRWIVQSAKGIYAAQSLILCAGYLHEPQMPAVPGLSEFPGKLFHSSRWDHAHDLSGERVAVIGTGASAIQFVPEIQPRVASLHVYQRTPQWILPKVDLGIPGLGRRLLALPLTLRTVRSAIYGMFEAFGVGFRRPVLLRQAQKFALAHLRHQVKDPVLRDKLTPSYTLGCKRVLLSNNYYPALTQPNVEVLATGVKELRGRTVVAHDGSEREVDTIILGTGFHVSDPPSAGLVRGADGRSLAEVWAGSPQAYRGTTVAGFPNLFLILGPNLAIGHNSAFIVIEAQLNYTMGGLRALRGKRAGRLEVRAKVQDDYNAVVQRELQGTVWNVGGCSSYYLDANGRNSIGFPWSTLKMRRLLARFDAGSYEWRKQSSKETV